MREIWYFKCLKCGKRIEEGLDHGDKTLLNVLEHVEDIRSALGGDETGLLEVSILGMGVVPIEFLMEHYGEEHDVVVYSEFGCIKRIGDWERCAKPPLGKIIRLHQAREGTVVCLYCGKHIKEWKPMEKCPARCEEMVDK